ncbi:hypothetical protein ACR0ST_11685 [Aliidiomarina sp. Khilg15.8]
MSARQVLNFANTGLIVFLLGFIGAAVGAYGFEGSFSLMTVAMLHVSQIVLAALFKISYVLRLAAQWQLGRPLH